MNKAGVALGVLALLGAGAAVAAARRQDTPAYGVQDLLSGAERVGADLGAWALQNERETSDKETPMPDAIYLPTQMAAMRRAIMDAEGTTLRADPYRVCYGYRHTIQSFSDHPAITREWRGEPLPDGMCEAAGLGPGCVSTAAGAYQINVPTWREVRGNLPDFSPASQDAACDALLSKVGAVAFLQRGDFAGAVNAARRRWASMPGAGWGQGERSLAWLSDRFAAAGGLIA